jgi:hypothetical protein
MWVPYEGIQKEKRYIHSMRWKILWPFQWRVPHLDFSLGEIIVLLATCASFIFGSLLSPPRQTMSSLDKLPYEKTGIHQSGHISTFALALTFATAAHNSIFTFLIGLPFERAIFWHK